MGITSRTVTSGGPKLSELIEGKRHDRGGFNPRMIVCAGEECFAPLEAEHDHGRINEITEPPLMAVKVMEEKRW